MYKTISKCRCCGSESLTEVFNMGLVPLANDFNVGWKNGRYPLHLLHCQNCWLGQLREVVKPEVLYSNYAYVTSTSETMKAHFEMLRVDIIQEHKKAIGFIAEIGSNTGDFLRDYQKLGCRVLGIDPSVNLSEKAEKSGIKTLCRTFQWDSVLAEQPIPDVIVARHVMCHIDDWRGFVNSLETWSHSETTIVIEVPYAGAMLKGVQIDTIYHEHLSYMTLTAMAKLLHGTKLFISKIKHYKLHGGTVVFFIKRRKHKGCEDDPEDVKLEVRSEDMGMSRWDEFSQRADGRVADLVEKVGDLRHSGKRIAGYGASAKSSVWVNLCNFEAKDIECIYDNTPEKMWTFSPGTEIPILPPDYLLGSMPDYTILFAWNYAEEIARKESAYLAKGGQFIIP